MCFIDDIIVHSADFWEHLYDLTCVWDRLRAAGLKVKGKKCDFVRKEVHFLGHVVSEKGISTDPKKVEKVRQCLEPTKVKEVRSFLGLTNYYRRFIAHYAEIAAPMYEATKERPRFAKWDTVWTPACTEAFHKLIKALTEAPVLKYPEFDKPFHLFCDASDYGVGNTLEQEDDEGQRRVVSYGGQKFSVAQIHYSQPEKECLAIFRAFKEYRTFLLGNFTTVYTDHQSLTYILNKRRTLDGITLRMFHWVIKLQEYDFEVKYVPGKKLCNADAMSREPFLHVTQADRDAVFSDAAFRQDDCQAYAVATRAQGVIDDDGEVIVGHQELDGEEVKGMWTDEVLRQAQSQDEEIRQMLAYKRDYSFLADSTQRSQRWVQQHQGDYYLDRGILHHLQSRYRQGRCVEVFTQIVIPESLRQDLVLKYHSRVAHMGWKRTIAALGRCYFWEDMIADVQKRLVRCVTCARHSKGPNPRVPLQVVEFPMEPWHTVAVDVLGPLPKSTWGNQYIISWVDYFTKWPEVVAIPDVTTQTILYTLRLAISHFGYPKRIIADRGTCFTSNDFRDEAKTLGIELSFITTGHHQSNGLVERWNRTLMEVLRKVVDGQVGVWDQRLPLVCEAYRATVHTATGDTPFRLNMGRDLELPEEPQIQLRAQALGIAEYIDDLRRRLQHVWAECKDEVKQHQASYKRQYDKTVNKHVFAIAAGDKVFILAKSIRDKGFHPKFKPLYDILYRVIRVEGYNLTLRVLNARPGKEILIHRDLCKLFQGTEEDYASYLKFTATQRYPEDPICGICNRNDALRTRHNKTGLQEWVGCDTDHDPYAWYHLECVGLHRVPTKNQVWYCPDCVEQEQ